MRCHWLGHGNRHGGESTYNEVDAQNGLAELIRSSCWLCSGVF